MKAENLQLSELVTFEDGSINFYGRRLVLHSMHAFAKLRKDMIDILGLDGARKLLTRFGYFWGQADAAGMKRVLEWNSMIELLKAGGRLHALEGVTPVTFDRLDYDEASGRLLIEVSWADSIETEEHLTEIGWADQPTCWKLTGYASGYATFCLGRPVYFIETQCRAKGNGRCRAVGRDLEGWGTTIEPHLPYFQVDDITDEIKDLTKELKRQMQELDSRRDQLVRLHESMDPYFVDFRSKALRQTFDLARRIASFDSSAIITGETGVGKEVLAQYIHSHSHRADGPFVAINCAALPDTLLESELFGYKAGAFTGAARDRTGILEQADGGTIFLDEIGDMSPSSQLKLLRVLQESKITRLGENIPRPIDVRVVSATHQDLTAAATAGEFRDDLLYRLKVIELEIPPLRDRPEDIVPLSRHIVAQLAKKLNMRGLKLDAATIDYLLAYRWPGNVRELANVLERGAILSRNRVIKPDCLPSTLVQKVAMFAAPDTRKQQSLREMEKKYIEFVLASVNGNKSRAAEVLAISPSTLWRKLKE